MFRIKMSDGAVVRVCTLAEALQLYWDGDNVVEVVDRWGGTVILSYLWGNLALCKIAPKKVG